MSAYKVLAGRKLHSLSFKRRKKNPNFVTKNEISGSASLVIYRSPADRSGLGYSNRTLHHTHNSPQHIGIIRIRIDFLITKVKRINS